MSGQPINIRFPPNFPPEKKKEFIGLVNSQFKIIPPKTKEEAIERTLAIAQQLGLDGYHFID